MNKNYFKNIRFFGSMAFSNNVNKSISHFNKPVQLIFAGLLLVLATVPAIAQSTTTTFNKAGDTVWTAPAGVTSITIQLWGGGGGGAATGIANGSGGGGGGAFTTSIISVVPGTTYTLHIGAGGAKGTGCATPSNGTDGENSWFSSPTTLFANAGKGGKIPVGVGAGGVGGIGGAASTGAGITSYAGGDGSVGGTSIALSPGGGGGGGSSAGTSAAGVNGDPALAISGQVLGGGGGIAPPGGGYGGQGGGYNNMNGLLTGVDGTAPGGGGGGAGNGSNPSCIGLNTDGGNGGNGRIIIITGQAIFNTTSSWTAPACITSVIVEAWGGGGAGGGNETTENGGGGGGGGAYSKSVITVIPGQTYAVTVGTGGVGVAGGTGTSGGDSWFKDATTILAKGGTGGSAPVGGAGGVAGLGGLASAGIGTTKYSGGDGGPGNTAAVGFGGGGGSSAGYAADGTVGGDANSLATVFVPAPGGVAPNGGGSGGDGQNTLLSGNGQSGFNPGGGGGGSSDIETGSGVSGGVGANGRIILSYPDAALVIGDNPVPAGDVCEGYVNVPIHSFTLTGSNGCNTETDIRFVTTGTYTAGEVVNFKLYYTTTNVFSTANYLTTTSVSTGPGTHSFPSISRPTGGTMYYYWITMDIGTPVTDGHTIGVDGTVPANITAAPTPTGSSTASGTQTFRNPPVLNSSHTVSICTGTTFTYTPTSASASPTFTWTRATVAGITEPGTSGGPNINEVLTNTTSAPINVVYTYTVTSPSSICAKVGGENVVVTVNPQPQGSISGNTICGADPFDLGQLTWVSATGMGPFSIMYDPGTVTESGVVSATSFTVNPSPIASTTYTITSVTDANGCIRTSGFTRDTATITVTSAPIVINTDPSSTTVCAGTNATFSVTATGVYSYAWEVSTDSGGSWTSVTSAAGAQPTYSNETTSALGLGSITPAHDGYVYRAVLSPACGATVTTSNTATLTVNPLPVLNSSTSTTTICSGSTFTYTPSSATGGASFTWSRAMVTGIKEAANSGPSDISEPLTNTTKASIDVTYNIVTTAGACSDTAGENIIVNVSPSPVLNSSLTPSTICSGDVFSYSPSSASLDTAFTWTRATIPGITEPGTSGVDKVNEPLTNTTTAAIDVKYVYVTTSANCSVGGAGDTVVVSVNPNGTIALTSAIQTDHQSICVNTPNTVITYTVGGSAVNASATGLPPGVSGVYNAGVFTISGTPIAAGVYTYSVSSIGTCPQDTVTGTDTVGISLISPLGFNDQWICINTPIDSIKYAVGGSGEGATVAGLPDGVTGAFAAGVFTISGTPTVAGGFTYTITTTGPCAPSTITGKISVGLGLISGIGTDSQHVCLNSPIVNISYRIVNGDVPPPTVIGLPGGLSGSITSPGVFTIVGTPSNEGSFTYTVTANGSCGSNSSVTGKVIVSIGRISAVGTDSQVVCKNAPITPIVYSVVSGATPTITGLPGGLTTSSPNSTTFTISGTPTVEGSFTYTISTKGSCSTLANIKGKVIVGLGLVSPIKTDSQKVCINTNIDTIKYAFAGGNNPPPTVTGLPATGFTTAIAGPGLFIITGKPTVAGLISYTVTAKGSCGSISRLKGKITVGIGLTSATGTDTAQSVCKNTPIVKITYEVVGGGTTTVSGLPSGLSGSTTKQGNPSIFTIQGTPSVAGTFNYTVTSTGGSCASSFVKGKIVIKEPTVVPAVNSGPTSQTICAATAIKKVIYNIGGTATGATVSTLPPGLTGTFSNGTFTIQGTPTDLSAGTYTYTITTTGGLCTQNKKVFTLTILNPIANFTADTLEGVAPLLVNFINQSLNSNKYVWSLGDSAASGIENPSNGYIKPGTYTVILTASQDSLCPDTASALVIVNESFFVTIPNVFTPNGDNVNDSYTILGADLAILDVEIYNRWGLKLYEWHTTYGGWDGRNSKNGMECPDGVYYYIVYAKGNNGKEVKKTGFFNLIR